MLLMVVEGLWEDCLAYRCCGNEQVEHFCVCESEESFGSIRGTPPRSFVLRQRVPDPWAD